MNASNTRLLPITRGLYLLSQFANWPIRAKIAFLFSLALIGIAIAVSAPMYFAANTLFTRQAETALDHQNEITAGEIDSLSVRASSDLLLARQNAAFNQLYLTRDQAALEAVQQQLLYLQDRFAIDEICVIAASGAEFARCVQGKLAGVDELSPDETSNPFFVPTLALADGEVYRSPIPYVSSDTHRWVVAHATPIVLPDGTKAGIFHFEVPLVWFAAKVDSNELAGGYSFLMTKDGQMLAHPKIDEMRRAAGIDPSNPDTAGFPIVAAWGSDDFHKLIERMKSGQAGRGTYRDGQETYAAVYQPVYGGQWVIATVLPQSVIYQPASDLLRQTLIITIPLLLLAVGLMLWYTAWLIAPINRLTDAAQQIADGDLSRRVRIEARDELGALATAFNGMTGQLQASQQQLAARNRALAISADISRRLSTLLEQKQIVSTVVEQVKAAFNYYHVHIYLYDEARENLIMAGGTGEAGKTMLARGHRVPKGRGLVGRAAENNLAVLVPDTTQDPGWLPNPLLPNTKAEVAVPIAFGDEVVGVLDVQHNVRGELSQKDADLLQSLANQIAIALRNARTLEQTRRRAEREAKVNVIGRHIQSADSVEDAMQIAVRELGRALNAQATRVKLRPGGPKSGNGHADGQELP
jgi:putative methionine-R-sulfoxide reductase with GAF domain